jgi:Trk K+ transport system NAD-binding subunit
MKSISTHLSYFLHDAEIQHNLRLLARYVIFLCVVIALYTVAFHFIMRYFEGEQHSWITGLYWTLTVMSTLGFGDITFQTDIGRLFSVIVLMTGIVMLLIVLPFAFIRFFYAPWLEAQIQQRAPRALPADTTDHVILCAYDPIASDLIERLERDDIPYVLLEPDASEASRLHAEDISVMIGEPDNKKTFIAARAENARLIFVNDSDENNTNITLTVREIAPDVPIATITTRTESIDVLELVGASRVLPIKKWLGEQLANRVPSKRGELLYIGEYGDLRLAELPLQDTRLSGHTVRETGLRERTGVSIIAVWERGRLQPAHPETPLTASSVPVVIGTEQQLEKLENTIASDNENDTETRPALIIGGGRVGSAAVRALHRKGVPVHLIEKERNKCEKLRAYCEEVYVGDASNYELLEAANIRQASSVVLTTNDDAINIYLSSYCRRLNADLRVISRITRERNLEAIHRAGADFVLSYASLGTEAILSILQEKALIVMGEGADLITREIPSSLQGKTLAETGIGARTGLNVVALSSNGELETGLSAATKLPVEGELLMIGSKDQLQQFVQAYES